MSGPKLLPAETDSSVVANTIQDLSVLWCPVNPALRLAQVNALTKLYIRQGMDPLVACAAADTVMKAMYG